MKQGIAKFSKEYVTETGLKEWAGIELPFDDEKESGVDALKRAEAIVNEHQRPKSYIVHYDNSAPVQYGPFETISQQSDKIEVGLTPELLRSCTDVVSLQSFYLLVSKSNRIDLKEAYDQRNAELVAIESKEIIDKANDLIKQKK